MGAHHRPTVGRRWLTRASWTAKVSSLVAIAMFYACERASGPTTIDLEQPSSSTGAAELVDVIVALRVGLAPGNHVDNKERAAEIARD